MHRILRGILLVATCIAFIYIKAHTQPIIFYWITSDQLEIQHYHKSDQLNKGSYHL